MTSRTARRSKRRPAKEVLDLLADCTPAVTGLALALRDLVLAEAPEAEEVLYSVYAQVIVFKLPKLKGGAFCGIVVYARHVNLMFYQGALLPDPHRMLTGTGKKMRHIRFDPAVQFSAEQVRGYIRRALMMVFRAPPAQ